MTRKDDKYLMFRNFMFNELGITREDINDWVKISIKELVNKDSIIKEINERLDKQVTEALYHSSSVRDSIVCRVSEKIHQDIKIRMAKICKD